MAGCQTDTSVQAPKGPPANPVKLFKNEEDPCVCQLHVSSVDQVGLLFKLCELLTSHGIDIVSAEVNTQDGIVNNCFELHTSRPSDFADAMEWCKELEEFLARNYASGGSALEGSLAAVSKRLSVNPDLLCVVCFERISDNDQPGSPLRYNLELEGINQAGLMTYTALVLYRSGFSIDHALISTIEGHVCDVFQLSTQSNEAEHLLRSYLDVPLADRKESVPLPFHVSPSDGNLEELMRMWGRHPLLHSPRGSFSSSPRGSRAGSFNEEDLDGWAQRSRLHSSISDREEPTRSSPQGAQDAQQAGGSSSSKRASTRDSRRMFVHFANGDVYTGNCVLFEDGQKRHGLGTYVYSPGTHESYKQYRGQWREDKKHGYGVLFYRNGGVYVGQWENNQKHGLGVLLDNTGETDAAQMPTFRYEGVWCEDEPHGLGAEESDMSSYFGRFVHGKRQGRGVRMNLAKLGSTGCEVVDDAGGCAPLLDALQNEMQSNARPSKGSTGRERDRDRDRDSGRDLPDASATYHFGNSMEAQVRPSLASISFGPQAASPRSSQAPSTAEGLAWAAPSNVRRGNSEHESGSSGKTSSDTRSPMSVGGQQLASPMEGQETPLPGSCAALQRTGRRGSGSAGGYDAGAHGYSHSQSASGRKGPACGSPRNGWGVKERGGSVEFSLTEENNLLSPPDTALSRPIPEERGSGGSAGGGGGESETTPALVMDGMAVQPELKQERSSRTPKVTVSDPWLPTGFLSDSQRPAGSVANDSLGTGSATPAVSGSGAVAGSGEQAVPTECCTTPSANLAAKKGGRQLRPIRTPLLWSEDELAAFISCLGVSGDVCERVQQRKLKGVVHLLEMTNSELRRDFGLTTPVERLMVRQALKRLLDADRWENSVRGHKVGDLLSDSVLSKFIVPLEELTLVTKISQGGYGTVYRGVLEPTVERGTLQAHRSHLVAVKEMKGEKRVRLYELLKEACVMASLNHPNICTFLGVCANANARKHYIISELMDCSLYDLIHQPYKLRWHGELTVALVVNLSKSICAGIVYLHGRNLVHADLKSSNILIDYSTSWQLVPRICDFGHAAVRTFPSPHHRCGTPHWAGPEVLRSEALGPAADIYSFGVIMWEMLAQKLPHKGMSFGQVVAAVGWAGWIPDMSLLPEIPHEIRRLLRECLSFSPSDRPASKDVQRRLQKIPKRARLKALKMLLAFFS